MIPPAVSNELLIVGPRFRPIDVSTIPFIEVRPPVGPDRLPVDAGLDPGETEALNLAMELGVETVLIDELRGRDAATRLGFVPVGTMGILLIAKDQGLIGEVKPLIDELRHGLGFFLSDTFVAQVLKRAGESE